MGFEDLELQLQTNDNKVESDFSNAGLTFQGATTTHILGNYDSDLKLLQWTTANDEVLDEFNGKTNDAITIAKIIEPSQIGQFTISTKNTYTAVGYPMIMVTGGRLAGPVKCDTSENALIHAAAERISYCVPLEVATNENNDVIVEEFAFAIGADASADDGTIDQLITRLIREGRTPEVTMRYAKASEIDDWRAKGDPDERTWKAYRFTDEPLEAIDNTWQVAYEPNESAALIAKFGIPTMEGLTADQALAVTLNNEFIEMSEQLINTQIERARTFKRVTQKQLTSEQITPESLATQSATVVTPLAVVGTTFETPPPTIPSFSTPTGTSTTGASSAAAAGLEAGRTAAIPFSAAVPEAEAPIPVGPAQGQAVPEAPALSTSATTTTPGGTGY